MRDRAKDLEEAKKKAGALLDDIAKVLRSNGHVVEVEKTHSFRHDREITQIDGVHMSVEVNVEHTGGAYHSHVSGKIRVKLSGSAGDTKQFPEPKAGHDVEKLVEVIIERLGQEKRHQEDRDARQGRLDASSALAKQLNKEYGFDEHEAGSVSGSELGMLRFDRLNVSGEQARVILTLLGEGRTGAKPRGSAKWADIRAKVDATMGKIVETLQKAGF